MSQTNEEHFTCPIDLNAEGQSLLKQVVEFYRQAFEQAEAAQDFLRKKGVTTDQIQKYRIGYADRTLGLFLPISTIKAGAVIRKQLQQVGLIRGTGHEHFNGAVVLPIFDQSGNIVQIYGRRFARGLARGTERYPRLNSEVFELFPNESSFAKVFLKEGDSVPSGEGFAPVAVATALPESFGCGEVEALSSAPKCEQRGEDYYLQFDKRDYRIRGLHKNTSLEVLRINLRLLSDEKFFLDELNLYSAKQRMTFVKQASDETGLEQTAVKSDLGKILFELEDLQQKRIDSALESKESVPAMSAEEESTALELLKSPNLLDRILSDFDLCGIVGESTNKLTGYLAVVSRHLSKPLAVLIQSTSAAGKSTLMEAVLSFVPSEEKVKYSAMTGQSLYYLGQSNLKHKVLAIAEEEGASKASYALKLLQSEGELNIASTGKDATSGRLTTEEYRVEGPVMLFFTTTSSEIDEELLNRCLILTVDEGREQTAAIHRLQRESRTRESVGRKQVRDEVLRTHHNAQRLLKPLKVLNPFASELTFRNDCTRTRRDHEKYLTLIDSIALLHQHQRQLIEHDGELCVEVTIDDIESANRLAHEVLGRSLDELPPQTRKLLKILQAMVLEKCASEEIEQCDCRFTQKELRDYSSWGATQVRVHLHRLKELEYLSGLRKSASEPYRYELLFDGNVENGLHLMGLLDVEQLCSKAGRSRGENDVLSDCNRNSENVCKADSEKAESESFEKESENRVKEGSDE